MTGKQLKEWRTKMLWTQKQLAEALEVTPRAVIAWENGDTPIRRMLVLALNQLEAEANPSTS